MGFRTDLQKMPGGSGFDVENGERFFRIRNRDGILRIQEQGNDI